MKKLIGMVLAGAAMAAAAQEVASAGAVTPVPAGEVPVKKVAIFVQNRVTRVPGLDDEVDGIRDRLAASLAAVDGIEIYDSAQIADTFRRYKVTTDEEKKGLVSGIFSGGSVPNVARMIGCDYIIAASVVGASTMKRNLGGQLNTVYTLRMTTKVMDATGRTVGSVPNWSNTFPVLNDAGDDPMNYYNILLDRWVEDATNQIAENALKWRKPAAAATALVSLEVRTSIDESIPELESKTMGANKEQLVQLRKVVGCASVEIDGAVIGTAPNMFKVSPGLHQIRVTRQWMQPYAATINVYDGMVLNVAMEMTSEGLAKWGTEEKLRADLARQYGEAAALRGVKVNINTSNWRDGVLGGGHGQKIKISD